jgi:hypothetical protein
MHLKRKTPCNKINEQPIESITEAYDNPVVSFIKNHLEKTLFRLWFLRKIFITSRSKV